MSEPTTFPALDGEEVAELQRILRLESAALVSSDGEQIELPADIHKILKTVVRYMSQGRSVTLFPDHQQITTQRAADVLGMSRPHLIKLLGSGQIPYHKNGTHRRLYLRDVLNFAKRRDEARHEALNRMAKEAFDAGLYEGGIPEGGSDE
jgi:excisionase family DNA binding protein